MFDPGALHITSWIVLVQTILLARYVWSRLELRIGWLPLGGVELLFFALAWCMLTSFFLLDFRAYEGGIFGGLSRAVLGGSLSFAILLAFLHPVSAVCLFVSCLFLRPWELLSNSVVMTALPKGMAAICALSWTLWTVRRKQFLIYFDKSCLFFLGFVLWLFISALASGEMAKSVELHTELFIPIIVTVFLVLNSSSSEKDIAIVRSTVVLSTLGVILSGFYLSYGVVDGSPDGRLRGAAFLGNANDLAALVMVALPLLVIPQLSKKRNLLSKFGTGVIAFVLLYGLWCTQSRGGMLALVAAGGTYFLLSLRRFKYGAIVTVLLAVLAYSLYANLERDQEDLEMSRVSRWNYVVAGFGMVKDYPLLGVGIGNYPKMYELYTPSFDEWGSRTAHSTWILILAESGLFGFGLFALLYFSVLHTAWKEKDVHPEFLVSLVAYTVAMTFLSHSYLFLPYLLFALILTTRGIRVRQTQVGTKAQVAPLGRGVRTGSRVGAFSVFLLFTFASLEIPTAEAQVTLQAVPGLNKPVGAQTPRITPSIRLSGSRGEVVQFLMKTSVPPGKEKGGMQCGKVSLRSKNSTQKLTLLIHRLETIVTEHPSFTGAYVGPHLDPAVPQPLWRVCIAKERATWLVGELWIGRNAQPGKSNWVLSWDGDPSAQLEIELTIWKMEMPETPALPAYMEMTPWWNLLGHYGEWREGEGRLSEKYFLQMRDHRVLPITAHVRVPEIEMKGGKAVLDLRNRPTPEDSFFAVNLQHRPFWAHFGFPTIVPEKIGAPETPKYFDAIENTLPSLREYGQPMMYLWDEPAEEVIGDVKRLAGIVKQHAPSLKVMVTTPLKKSLEDVVDIFVPVMDQYGENGFPGNSEYKEFRKKKGKEVWWYVSCMSHGCEALGDTARPDFVLDRPSVYIRAIPWLSMKYGIDAFLYFSVNYAYQHYPKRDPWKSVWDFSGNGDGTLFYPGRPGVFGLEDETAVPALRLKVWREASYDAEYIRWMNSLPSVPTWWKQEFDSLTRSTVKWSRDYDRYSALRNRAGEYLNSLAEER